MVALSGTLSVATFESSSRKADSGLAMRVVRVLDELEALRVFHSRTILDRLDVLLVVESDCSGIHIQDMSQFVADSTSNFFVPAVFEPNLEKVLSGSDAETRTNH